MSRRSAAFDDAAPARDSSTDDRFSASEAPTWAEDKNPTRPLPVFRLEEEARRLDQEAAAAATRCDEDATVTVSAEENMKLLASVFAAEACNTDDEPTLDAPAPASPEAIAALAMSRPARITACPPALQGLVITRPAPVSTPRPSVVPAAVISPAAVPPSSPAVPPLALEATPTVLVPPQSGFRPRISPELVAAARDLREAEDARRTAATFKVRVKKRDMQTYLVAGIWAMALSLIALLVLMTTSA